MLIEVGEATLGGRGGPRVTTRSFEEGGRTVSQGRVRGAGQRV